MGRAEPATRVTATVSQGGDSASVECPITPSDDHDCARVWLNGMLWNTEPHPLQLLYLALREIFGQRENL